MNEPNFEFVCPECGAQVTESDSVCPQCRTTLEWDTGLSVAGKTEKPEEHVPDVGPMRLGDIFDWAFRLFGRTFTRSILVMLILFVPVSLLLIEGSREFYGTIGRIAQEGGGTSAQGLDELAGMLRSFGLFGLALLLAFLATLAGELAVTLLIRNEFARTSTTWREALGGALSIRYLRALGVVLVQIIVVCGVVFGVVLIPVILVSIAGGGALVVVLAFLIAFGCIVYFLIRWSLAFTVVACEDRGIGASLGRSWALVAEKWWRTFGILLLMGVLVNFAIALVVTPLSLIAFWDFYREYFKALGTAGTGQPDPAMLGKAMSSIGPGVGLSMTLNFMLLTMTKPVYTTVVYVDLCARKRESEKASAGVPITHQSLQPDAQLPEGSSPHGV